MVTRRIFTDPDVWLAHIVAQRGPSFNELAAKALDCHMTPEQLVKGMGIADILLTLELDNEGIATALVYPSLQAHEIDIDAITDHLGVASANLLRDVLQMQALPKLSVKHPNSQIENLRKMLLAMVTDVRAVLIILAERLWLLRALKKQCVEDQQKFARETLAIYSPLANRLGVSQLKWEMEDLCLRYLEPDHYKKIAKMLTLRREEREQYIQTVIKTLQQHLPENIEITGRAKHIYSIYRKMQRKKIDLNAIYDISAVRILLPDIASCYQALSLVHNIWQQIPEEFDDYISHPKPNGYRSIHTAVIGPDHHTLEVQIRTKDMHQESELGVAAHWRYKEGGASSSNYEAKIAWLRQVMAWQKELLPPDASIQDLFADRIYVFTPTNEIVDLPQGSTPLDFAYQIHSEVGHRCRGAKIDGAIIPLTYTLQTGQRIEILTTKQAHPSRDWLSPHLGYLKTARARSKVQHWFKMRDYEQNLVAGRELLTREMKRMGINSALDWSEITRKLSYKNEQDIFAALGAGSLRVTQLLTPLSTPLQIKPIKTLDNSATTQGLRIQGISNLASQMAKCCKPLPGDVVVGFVSRLKGVTIHRQDCHNILQFNEGQRQRLMEVDWGHEKIKTYAMEVILHAYQRSNLLRDITALLSTEKIEILGLSSKTLHQDHEIIIHFQLAITDVLQLEKILDRLQHLSNVISVRRG